MNLLLLLITLIASIGSSAALAAAQNCDLLFAPPAPPTSVDLRLNEKSEEQLLELLSDYNFITDPIKRKILQKNIANIQAEILKTNPRFSIQELAKRAKSIKAQPISEVRKQSIDREQKILRPELNLRLQSEDSLQILETSIESISGDLLAHMGINKDTKHSFQVMKGYGYSLIRFAQPKFMFLALGTKDRYFLKLPQTQRPVEIKNFDPKTNTMGSLFAINHDQNTLISKNGDEVRLYLVDKIEQSIDFANPIREFKVAERFVTHVVQKMELSPDQRYLAMFTADQFFIHDIDNNRLSATPQFRSHGEISFSPDSNFVAITEGKSGHIYEISKGLTNPVFSETFKVEFGYSPKIAWTRDSQNVALVMMGQNEPYVGFVYNPHSQMSFQLAASPLSSPLRWSSLDLQWSQSQNDLIILTGSAEKSLVAKFDSRLWETQEFEIRNFKPIRIKDFDSQTLSLEGTAKKESSTADLLRKYSLY